MFVFGLIEREGSEVHIDDNALYTYIWKKRDTVPDRKLTETIPDFIHLISHQDVLMEATMKTANSFLRMKIQ